VCSIHCPDWHWNCCCAWQVPQSTSSSPLMQSITPLHFHADDMHQPSAHRNWSVEHESAAIVYRTYRDESLYSNCIRLRVQKDSPLHCHTSILVEYSSQSNSDIRNSDIRMCLNVQKID
jgi:hypothetical protein